MIIEGPLCQSGGKTTNTGRLINEDGLVSFNANTNEKNYTFIIIMDGASGLGKNHEIETGLTSAEWYVQFIMSEIKKIFMKNPTFPLKEAIESSILKAINKISNYEHTNGTSLTEYEKPSASLSILRTDGITTDIFLIGDINIIIGYKNSEILKVNNPNQNTIQKLDNNVISRMVEIANKKNCDFIDTMSDLEIQSMLQVNRSKKNTNYKDSYWVCGTTLEATKHGVSLSIEDADIDGIILSTDGFDYSILNIDENTVYNLIKQYGTNYISKNIRNTQEIDAKCNNFPRFKKSDDLTVVFCNYN